MQRWLDPIGEYSQNEVMQFCIEDKLWQSFLRTLQNLSTEEKLTKLYDRRDRLLLFGDEPEQRKYDVQTWNALNILRSGGFLDNEYRVLK